MYIYILTTQRRKKVLITKTSKNTDQYQALLNTRSIALGNKDGGQKNVVNLNVISGTGSTQAIKLF